MRYTYSLIRFVPDPFREEQVNVGALVGNDETGEWEVIAVGNLARARAIQHDPKAGTLAVARFLDWCGQIIDQWTDAEANDEEAEFAPTVDWLRRLHHTQNRVVQVAAPEPVSAESLAEAIDAVRDRFLVDPVSERLPYKSRRFARSVARAAYAKSGLKLGETLFEHVTLESAHSRETIDFAVVNGSALQLTQAWSFDLPRQEQLAERVKAWGWSLSRVRQHGGGLHLGPRSVDVADNIDIAVIYLPPRPGEDLAYEAAQGIFEDLKIESVDVDSADTVAQRGVELLGGKPDR